MSTTPVVSAPPTHLRPDLIEPACAFVRSPLWREMKECLRERATKPAAASAPSHEYAQTAAEMIGWLKALDELETLSTDIIEDQKPFIKPTLTDETD